MKVEALIDIEPARDLVLERATPLGSERLPLRLAEGRILAEPVVSRVDVPGFDNSAMDGFSLRAADTDGADEDPRSLRIVDESRAGHPASTTLASGEAIAISTGAMVPAGRTR